MKGTLTGIVCRNFMNCKLQGEIATLSIAALSINEGLATTVV